MTLPDTSAQRFDLRQIRHVVVIADCGSITKAAARLGLSQPTLSASVVQLESELGAKLFLRLKRGVVLTEAGDAFARRGRQILALIDDIVTDMARLKHSEQCEIAIGLPLALIDMIGVLLVESMAHAHPEIRLRITEAASPLLIESLERGKLDLAVCYEGYDFEAFDAAPILEEELFLATAPDNWKDPPGPDGIVPRPMRFIDLKSLPLALPSQAIGMRRVLDRFAKSRSFGFSPIYELDSLLSLLSICARASGYSIHGQMAAMNSVRNHDLVLVPIEDPTPVHTSFLLRRRDEPVSAASLLVEKMLLSALREMIGRYNLRARLKR